MSESAPQSESAPPPPAPRRPLVRRLRLEDFRSYARLDLPIEGRLVVFSGENGAGKTNLLEALSLFTPGRGLRRAEFAECARVGGAGGFAIGLEIENDGETRKLGTGLAAEGSAVERRNRIDGAAVPSSRAFAEHLRVVWLTPAMDGLFSGSAGERRRFLDRLVLTLDSEHGSRANRLERALRGRNRLLEEGARSGAWLDAIERETAEIAVAVAAARVECTARLAALVAATRDETSPFPWPVVALDGQVEAWAAEKPALEAEDLYRATLRENRSRDAAAGRTLIGPHVADFVVRHGPKDAPAEQCSTGEQKALLVALVLAHARLTADMSGIAPIALLDEIAAHFDPRRRAALFAELEKLGGQVFMTGADAQAFGELRARAAFYDVEPGAVRTLGASGVA